MNSIILDTSVAEADALKTKNIQINISSDGNIGINGKQTIPYAGGAKDLPLDFYYNLRVAEIENLVTAMPAGEEKTKQQAKIDVATAYLTAVEIATATYMQAIYELENPVTI